MSKVIAYLRVSTDGQCGEDKFGLDVQKATIEEYCNTHNYEIVKWVCDEGESGAKTRPGFDSIVYDAPSTPSSSQPHPYPYDAVIVAKSDRVARDINIYYYYKMLLRKKGIKLISIAEDFGQFGVFANMLEAFTLCVAEMERENINKRTSGGRQQKASHGGYSGGKAPMGYEIKDGNLTINPKEAAVVRRIFELKETATSHPLTLQDIADILNADPQYSTRSGKPFVVSTIYSILNNRKTYEGYYRYGKDGKWVQGQHMPILPAA